MADERTTHLSLTLFAGFGLHEPSGASIRLPTKNARALLAFLAVQPDQPQSREKLTTLLWGERSDKQARHSLNQTLVQIRKAIPETDGGILDSNRENVTVIPGSIAVDALKFRELVAERPKDAMDLYTGPFLDGIGIREAAFADWLSAQRSEFHDLACGALEVQCERSAVKGRHAEAIEAAKRLVTLDPLREETHRQLMRLYHEVGDRSSALKQYHTCVEILERELDVEPAGETTQLFDEIKRKGQGPAAENKAGDPDRQLHIDDARSSEIGRNPSIAVLPFDNLSGDPKQEYFSDGVSEDVITELSRYPDFLVIARHSTFVYKGKAADHKQVAQDLGVQYVLEGSVRRTDDRVRISAQLVDAATGSHLWAERYDRTLKDIFAVQDEIIATIVSRLGDTLRAVGIRRATSKDPNNLDAYDKSLQAWAHSLFHNRAGKDNNAETRRLAEEAIALDPGYARAYAILARTYVLDSTSCWVDDPDQALKQSYEIARKAVSLDNQSFYAYQSLGMAQVWLGRHEQAIASLQRAIELNPNDADTHAHFANVLVFAGRPDDALEEIETAMRLNPHYPEWYLQHQGRAYFTQRRHEEAASAFERVVAVNPGWPWAHLILAATRAALGMTEEAAAAVAEARKISPALTLAHVPKAWPFKNPADLDHMREMLQKAGLPE